MLKIDLRALTSLLGKRLEGIFWDGKAPKRSQLELESKCNISSINKNYISALLVFKTTRTKMMAFFEGKGCMVKLLSIN